MKNWQTDGVAETCGRGIFEPDVAARRQTVALIHRDSENAREQLQNRANIWFDPADKHPEKAGKARNKSKTKGFYYTLLTMLEVRSIWKSQIIACWRR